jgi:DNA-directed RNA polymerase subunit RPC12/RpoP
MKRTKLLSLQEVPKFLRNNITINHSVRKIGTKHHKELHSEIECFLCKKRFFVRNSRIRTFQGFNCPHCHYKIDENLYMENESLDTENIANEYFNNKTATLKSLSKKYNTTISNIERIIDSKLPDGMTPYTMKKIRLQQLKMREFHDKMENEYKEINKWLK